MKAYRIRSYYYLSKEKQQRYKYILHIPGNVAAFRLAPELSMGCCILLVQNNYKVWYRRFLKPYEHFVPVKSDLSDLISQIKWCKKNDAKCKQIAENSVAFHRKYLSRKNLTKYFSELLWSLSSTTGNYYQEIYHNEWQHTFESKILDEMIRSKDNSFVDVCHNDKRLVHKTKRKRSIVELVNNSIIKKTHPQSAHETFIGLKCVNELASVLPHFIKTHHHHRYKEFTLTNYVQGVRFSEWIRTSFDFITYIRIIYMVSKAMQYAFHKYGFIHWDLTPNNIMIKRLHKNMNIIYPDGTLINTTILPVIIDYNTSHFIYKDTHIGTTHPFKYTSSNDVRMLILTSLDNVFSFQNNKCKENDDIQTLFSFLQENMTRSEMINYISEQRKYETLLAYRDQTNSKSISNFVSFLEINYQRQIAYKKNNVTVKKKNKWSLFVCYHTFLRSNIPTYSNIASSYIVVHTLDSLLKGLYETIPDKELYDACMDKLTKYFKTNIVEKKYENYTCRLDYSILNCNEINITKQMIENSTMIDTSIFEKITHHIKQIANYKGKFEVIQHHNWLKNINVFLQYCFNIKTLRRMKE